MHVCMYVHFVVGTWQYALSRARVVSWPKVLLLKTWTVKQIMVRVPIHMHKTLAVRGGDPHTPTPCWKHSFA